MYLEALENLENLEILENLEGLEFFLAEVAVGGAAGGVVVVLVVGLGGPEVGGGEELGVYLVAA